MTIFSSSHSRGEYESFLRDKLPEYRLETSPLPAPGQGAASELRFTLLNPTLAKYGSERPHIHPKQPNPLIITGNAEGKKRLADLKHYVNKRNLIIEVLATNAQAREGHLALKAYTRWDDFVVGHQDHDTLDTKYEHLASLRADLEKMKNPLNRDWFKLRRFFHSTTEEQKKEMIEQYLREQHDYYELVEFRGKNDFVIAPKDPALAREVPRVHIHSFSELRRQFGESTGPAAVGRFFFGRLINYMVDKDRERRLAEEIARIRALVSQEDAIYIRRDTLQREFATIQHDVTLTHGSTVHNILKAIKEKIVGTHVKTHPWRKWKLLSDAVVRPVGRFVTHIRELATTADPLDVGAEMVGEARQMVLEGRRVPHTEEGAVETVEVLTERPGDHWYHDLGFGRSAAEQDAMGWQRIQSAIESIGVHERHLKETLHTIGAGASAGARVEGPSCAHVHEVLYRHAKILYHTRVMRKEFRERLEAFRAMRENIRTARQQLEEVEDTMKRVLTGVLSAEVEAYRMIETIDLKRYNLVRNLSREGATTDEALARDVLPSPGFDSPEAFLGPDASGED
jgi:predicted secreted Zn-dependent protease